MAKHRASQSILVIKGNTEEIRNLRRAVISGDLVTNSSNAIFDEDRLNSLVPDLPNGYERFNDLLMLALRGPKIMKLRTWLKGWS